MRASIRALALWTLSIGWAAASDGAPPPAAEPSAPLAVEPTPAAAPPEATPAPALPPWRAAQELVEAITVGFRGAWAQPLGDLRGPAGSSGTIRFGDELGRAFPFTVEVGYRAARRFVFGAYFSYGVAELQASALNGGCSTYPLTCERGRTQRLGAQLLYRFVDEGPLVPWAGVGFGYEWTGFDVRNAAAKASVTYEGMELLNLQVGGDYRFSEGAYVGPYAALTIGKFDKASVDGDLTAQAAFPNPALHHWLMLGLRGGVEF